MIFGSDNKGCFDGGVVIVALAVYWTGYSLVDSTIGIGFVVVVDCESSSASVVVGADVGGSGVGSGVVCSAVLNWTTGATVIVRIGVVGVGVVIVVVSASFACATVIVD